jgi:transposase-like protein
MTIDSEAYVFKFGLICPNCESGNIETIDSVTVHQGCATQSVMCNVCEATWDDQYNLDAYANLELHEKHSKDGRVSDDE